MNSMQRPITMGNEMQNRTLSTLGTDYPLKRDRNVRFYTLWDPKSFLSLCSECSKQVLPVILSLSALLVFFFIPVSSDGELNSSAHASDYAQGYSERLLIPDFNRLADAIYSAEGGAKTRHPYGIISIKCSSHQECRKICLNTINASYKRYLSSANILTDKPSASVLGHPEANTAYPSFVTFLSKTYAPVGARNDPSELNRNWIKNVNWFLKQNMQNRYKQGGSK